MAQCVFDYGFGPFRWVCASGEPADLDKTDAIAARVLNKIMEESPEEIQQQMQDNITWINDAKTKQASCWLTSTYSLCRCARPYGNC